MIIQKDLVCDKHAECLTGYVDLRNAELNVAALKKTVEFTSDILVFLVRSIVNSMKFTLANLLKEVPVPSNFFLYFGRLWVFWRLSVN